MAVKAPPTATTQIDFLVGLVGGLVGILFLITALLELTGQSALLWALVLAAAVAVLGGLLLRRRRILRSVSGGPSTSREG
jgi:LPXTG-motif cell wall-anchored protein